MPWTERARVDLTVDDTILAILSGRPWPTADHHIWNDRAWSYVEDSTRPDSDFPVGPPSSTTMEAAYRRLMKAGLIEWAAGEPRAYEATAAGHEAGKAPQDLLRAHIAQA